MKITVANDSPDRMLTVTQRADGIRTQGAPIAPLSARSFILDKPNASVSFSAGPAVEATGEPSAAPVPPAPVAPTASDAAVLEQAILQHAEPRTWNETRALAIKLGAPKNVTKAEAETLIAAHEAAQPAEAAA